MEKISAMAASSPEGLPSMQFDGRRLLADPEAPGCEEDVAAGHQRMAVVMQTASQFRSAGLAALLGLLVVGAVMMFFAEVLDAFAVRVWVSCAVLLGIAGMAGWLLSSRLGLSPFRIWRWRFAGALWGLCALATWGAAQGYFLSMPWNGVTALGLVATALVAAMLLVAASHWLPALLFSWLGLLAAQLLVGTGIATVADSQTILIVGFDLVLLALGMVLGLASREMARRTVAERMCRQELAGVKGHAADQIARLNAETDQRRDVEQALLEARGAADMALRAKTEFLATMSHEIRTPLNGILPILEILRESRLDDEQRQFLETAYNSSRHLLRIINDVLDFAKAESGKLELESIEIDLRELVESITDLMGKSAERRGLKLSYKISDEVPRRVRGDPIRLRQVLTNLVSNAIKFTENGSICIELHKRRASRKEVELVFTVTDTGIGMTREAQRRLFRAFGQADASTTRKYGGTGLGLVICKRLVELMGGRIGVKSQPGEGASFWFVLPMRKSASDVPPARKDLSGLRVLTLVEDQAEAGKLTEVLSDWSMLEEKADSILAATNRLQSSAQLGKSWGFDLVLLSYSGSKMGLMPLLQEMRGEPALRELKVVLFTGSSTLRAELQKEPGLLVMEGPINYQLLQRRLNRLFDVEGRRIKSEEDTEVLFDSLALDFDPKVDAPAPQHPVVRGDTVARALLVEDNPVNLSVARRMLAKLGIDTLVARDGREALQVLEQAQVDLVFMDCQMPVMDGYEATRRLRAAEEDADPPRHLPVVAMTANAMVGDREKCLEAGMDDYLAKPLEFASLRRAIEPWVRLRDGNYYSTRQDAGSPRLPEDAGSRADEPADVVDDAAGPPAADNAVAPIDEARLAGLRELMAEELPRLIREYLDSVPGLLQELDQAAVDEDLEAMVRPAHTLKSSSANLCAMRLSAEAAALEKLARTGELEAALRVQRGMAEEFAVASRALQALLN